MHPAQAGGKRVRMEARSSSLGEPGTCEHEPTKQGMYEWLLRTGPKRPDHKRALDRERPSHGSAAACCRFLRRGLGLRLLPGLQRRCLGRSAVRGGSDGPGELKAEASFRTPRTPAASEVTTQAAAWDGPALPPRRSRFGVRQLAAAFRGEASVGGCSPGFGGDDSAARLSEAAGTPRAN